jgi:hypothetical protein
MSSQRICKQNLSGWNTTNEMETQSMSTHSRGMHGTPQWQTEMHNVLHMLLHANGLMLSFYPSSLRCVFYSFHVKYTLYLLFDSESLCERRIIKMVWMFQVCAWPHSNTEICTILKSTVFWDVLPSRIHGATFQKIVITLHSTVVRSLNSTFTFFL